jgi:hypothetical protein
MFKRLLDKSNWTSWLNVNGFVWPVDRNRSLRSRLEAKVRWLIALWVASYRNQVCWRIWRCGRSTSQCRFLTPGVKTIS